MQRDRSGKPGFSCCATATLRFGKDHIEKCATGVGIDVDFDEIWIIVADVKIVHHKNTCRGLAKTRNIRAAADTRFW